MHRAMSQIKGGTIQCQWLARALAKLIARLNVSLALPIRVPPTKESKVSPISNLKVKEINIINY